MLVTLLGHAETLIEAGGRRILLDPWLAEPVFAGAWFRYPPRPYRELAELGPLDAVLLSHEHPDHAGVGTLRALPPEVPIYAMEFESPTLRRNVERAGRANVHWLKAAQTHRLSPGLAITFLPHSAGWQVASILVEGDGATIYHGNDNALPLDGYQAIARRFPRIDLALLPFAGASSYPTCFEWSVDVIAAKGEAKKREGVQRLEDGIRGLKPIRAAPFASSWALLEPSAVDKNYVDRPGPDEAIERASAVAREHGTQLIGWEPGDTWSPEAGLVARSKSRGWGHDLASVRRYAAEQAARVASAIAEARQVPQGAIGLKSAAHEYVLALLDASRAMVSELDATIGLVSGEVELSMRFARGAPPRIEEGVVNATEVLLIAPSDLWAILIGTWLWEDLWYGYRVRVRKREGTPYYQAFWDSLLFFDDFELKKTLRARYGG